jgi:aminoglycoside phosphotransferase (APT) family kinase protein
MAIVNSIDPQSAEINLTAWLAAKLPRATDVRVSNVTIPSGSGGSNETVLLDAAWTEDGQQHTQRMVARVLPADGAGVFPDYDLQVEFDLIAAVGEHSSVPVPTVRWLELDPSVLGSGFILMDFVAGRTLGDDPPFTAAGWFLELTTEQQYELHDGALKALVDFHAVSWDEQTLARVTRRSGTAPGIAQLVKYYEDYFTWASEGTPNPTVEAGLAWAHENQPADSDRHVLCHGDARVGNMIFDDENRVTAVLDWEAAAVAAPEYDLGWWILLNRHHTEGIGVPRPQGLPSTEDVAKRYEELSGRTVENLHYYEVFAALRLSLLMVRTARLMKDAGYLPQESEMAIDNPASQILAELLGLPAPSSAGTTSFFGALS